MKGNDQSPSGSGRSFRGTCVPLLCQSRLDAELDVAALALVLLGSASAKGTKAALWHLCGNRLHIMSNEDVADILHYAASTVFSDT